jgi:hypothetical protein
VLRLNNMPSALAMATRERTRKTKSSEVIDTFGE